jgi:hypothetical protein
MSLCPLQRMFRGDEGLFDEAFMYGCPKFITAAPPAYDNPSAAGPQEVRDRKQTALHSISVMVHADLVLCDLS